MTRSRLFQFAAVAGLGVLAMQGAEVKRLSLNEAVHLAVTQNRALKIARLKVTENEQKKAGARADYFPRLTNQSNILHTTNLENIGIPAGALGIAGGSYVPSHNLTIQQGRNTLYSSGTQVTQPLTQLIRVNAAYRVAAAEVAVSRADLKNVETQVALRTHALYYGILIARLQKQAAEQQTAFAGENLRESEEDVRHGSALKVAAVQGRAGLLESQQTLLTAEIQIADLTTELNDLLGLPLDTQLELDPGVAANFVMSSREEYVQAAWSENPEISAAEEVVHKARAGVRAAKSAYVPDVTAFARHSYQDGVPFLVHNFGTFGVNMSWDVFDFGKRRAAVRERESQLAQAEQNVERLKDEVAVRIDRSYHKLERTRHMIEVANQVVALRKESERLSQNQLTQGIVLVADRRQASAATYKAQADYLQANLGYLLAWAELEQAVGRTPGF